MRDYSKDLADANRRCKELAVCWAADDRLVEIHRESWAGQAARRALLAHAGIALPDDLGEVGSVPPDDILDAAAAAWTAHRFLDGQAVSLPDPPQLDARGRPVAIWY
ncbi:DUF429 domain-containing protein [Kitasatospora sp. McL0602]|uniref:DUF429 domain-containing protein n=1 Tax=Kitasatospora sp. McL0602 TaxID=3439530 RepID=UPI003F89ABB3